MRYNLVTTDGQISLECDEMEVIHNALMIYQIHLDEAIKAVENGKEIETPSGILDLGPFQREAMLGSRAMAYDLRDKLVKFVGVDLTTNGC